MPRNARNNRTDLLGPRREPISAAPGQAYGRATAQRQAQKILPIGPNPTAAAGSTPEAAPAEQGGAAAAPPNIEQLARNANLKWIHPTDHPNEPVTTGLPVGPGAGPEDHPLLQAGMAQRQDSTAPTKEILRNMAQLPGASNVIKELAANS